jgi:hypothetical protein
MSRISGSSRASKLMGRAGDGSTLSLDFTAMGSTIDSRITFSRADATPLATFVNSLGYVTTVATAQAPRFDFDPTTLAAKGLLLEAPSTNKMFGSESLAASGAPINWQFTDQVTRNATYVTSPRGAVDAVTVNETVANNIHRTGQFASPGYTVGAVCTFSCWAKVAKSATPRKLFVNLTQLIGSSGLFDLTASGSSGTAQATAGTAVNRSTSWTKYPGDGTNNWYRVTVTGNFVADATIRLQINRASSSAATDDSFIGETDNGLVIWGAQFELGTASSYIPTGVSQVTRAVDTAIIAAGSNFSSWYTGGTTGTFVSNWYGSASSATARSVIATSDQTTKHLHMYQTPSALTLRLADFNAAATITTANSLTADALAKGAFSYNGTATSLCLNGGTVATGTLAFSAAPTWLSIGGPSTNGTSITATDVMLNNSIRTLKYFPTRLSDGQIQGLTT